MTGRLDPLVGELRRLLAQPYRLPLRRLWLLLMLVAVIAAGCAALITRYPAPDEAQPSLYRGDRAHAIGDTILSRLSPN